MKHPVLACRLRTSARAPGCALRPKALHHVHTHAHAHSHMYTHSCAQANRRFRTSETVQFSLTFLTSPVPAPVPLSPLVKLWDSQFLRLKLYGCIMKAISVVQHTQSYRDTYSVGRDI